MTYNVLGGTLNLAQLSSNCWWSYVWKPSWTSVQSNLAKGRHGG